MNFPKSYPIFSSTCAQTVSWNGSTKEEAVTQTAARGLHTERQ